MARAVVSEGTRRVVPGSVRPRASVGPAEDGGPPDRPGSSRGDRWRGAGASLLDRLAQDGRTDVVPVEKEDLTSGSTWHAAGQITRSAA